MTVKKLYIMNIFAMKRQEDVSRECEQIIGQYKVGWQELGFTGF